MEIAGKNIVSGYKDSKGNLLHLFGPANAVTYAETSKILVLAAGLDMGQVVASSKNPKAKFHWANRYLSILEKKGLAVYSPKLSIDLPATRGAFLHALLQAFDVPIEKGLKITYTDLAASSPYAQAIMTATKLGIIGGDTDASGKKVGTVRPNIPLNRAEVAKIVVRMMEKVKK